MTAVITAAGAGSRLGALGARYSKPMVPVADRPLIDWVMQRLRDAAVERIVVVAHADDHALHDFLRAAHPDVAVAIQAQRRGIADALCCALPLLGDAPAYLACACDSLFPADEIAALMQRGRQHAGAAVVGVLQMDTAATSARSAVRVENGCVTEIVEKPAPGTMPSALVAAPLYWLPRSLDRFLAGTPARGGERYVSSALGEFLGAGGTLLAMPLSGRLEVTTADDVAHAARALRAAPA